MFFSTLTDNSAPNGGGGAVYVAPNAAASLFFDTLTSNSAVDGGAIFVGVNSSSLDSLNLGASTFTDNRATGSGGALFNAGATIIESYQLFGPPGEGTGRAPLFTGNTAGKGGAIAQSQKSLASSSGMSRRRPL